MTVNEKLEELLSALDPLIESARSCVDDAPSFQKVNESIAKVMSESWPPIAEALTSIEPDAEMRARIAKMSEKLADLDTRTRARLVWADDFEDYIREAATQRR